MRATRIIIGLLGAITVVSISLNIHQASAIRRTADAILDENVNLSGKLISVDRRIAELQTARVSDAAAPGSATDDQLQPSTNNLETARATERARQIELAKKRARDAKAVADASERFLLGPEMQEQHFKHFKANLAFRYGPLYRALGLSAGQIHEFENVLAENFWANADLTEARITQGSALTEVAYAELSHRLLTPLDDKLHALLGDAGFQRYQQFENAAPSYEIAETLAGKLFDSAAPLSAPQADQIVQIISAHIRSGSSTSPTAWLNAEIFGRDNSPRVTWKDVSWDDALPQLQGVLAPAQFKALQALREQSEARQKAATLQSDFKREFQLQQQESSQAVTPPAAPSRAGN